MERNSRRLVIALASALGLALLVIVFLLGRITAKSPLETVAAPAAVVSAAASEPVTALPASAEASPEAGTAPLSILEPAGFAAPVPEPAPMAAGAPGLAPSAPSADQQIAAYFNQVDRLEDMGAGDPQAFAASLVQSMSSGDFSGFDDLLAKARAQRQRLLSIAPPAACLEHHRLALSLSADSVAMLERLKAALMKGDATALLGISTEGKTLETQANQLKTMGESIKRRAGL